MDKDGNPAGGHAHGVGFTILWQNGPLGRIRTGERKQPNGAFVEDIIRAAADRIGFYQGGKFACDENAEALTNLRQALDALNRRTQRRIEAGTEGVNEGN